jgi:predicted HAD superfamily Cof-like phosphohydrolase
VNSLDLVREFHDAFGVVSHDTPNVFDRDANALRLRLLAEELDELAAALAKCDAVAALDALTDLQYVLDGAYLALGFHAVKDRAFAEVHRSNMTKLGADGRPVLRPDGKITKGPNYSPPDLQAVIADHMARRLCERHDVAFAKVESAIRSSFVLDDYGVSEVLK